MSLNPAEIGWVEFGARVGLAVLLLLALLVAVLFTGRVVLTLYDAAAWAARKINGEGEEMSHKRARMALLGLVPTEHRSRAEGLLNRLLRAGGAGGKVFIAEYDGKPATVHMTPLGAMSACARHLASEPGSQPTWDWLQDEYGWVMCRVDITTAKPLGPLGGKVTRATVAD